MPQPIGAVPPAPLPPVVLTPPLGFTPPAGFTPPLGFTLPPVAVAPPPGFTPPPGLLPPPVNVDPPCPTPAVEVLPERESLASPLGPHASKSAAAAEANVNFTSPCERVRCAMMPLECCNASKSAWARETFDVTTMRNPFCTK